MASENSKQAAHNSVKQTVDLSGMQIFVDPKIAVDVVDITGILFLAKGTSRRAFQILFPGAKCGVIRVIPNCFLTCLKG